MGASQSSDTQLLTPSEKLDIDTQQISGYLGTIATAHTPQDKSQKRCPNKISSEDELMAPSKVSLSQNTTDQAEGITDANRPDPFKRLFSTVTVLNETAEQKKDRKHRRREIIRDNGSPDDDLAGVGEPRQIVRLYHKILADNGEAWKPLTEDMVRELMLIGRDTDYADVRVTEEKRECPSVFARVPGPQPDEMDIEKPHKTMTHNLPKPNATSQPTRPTLTRQQPMSKKGGVAMSRGVTETKGSVAKDPLFDDSLPNLRWLQAQAKLTLERFMTDGVERQPQLKKEMRNIRDIAVSLEAPLSYARKRRAARIIVEIIDFDLMMNGGRGFHSTEYSDWYDDDEFNTSKKLRVKEAKLAEIQNKMMNLPKGTTFWQHMMDKKWNLMRDIELIEEDNRYYDDEDLDDEIGSEDDIGSEEEADAHYRSLQKKASKLEMTIESLQEQLIEDVDLQRALAESSKLARQGEIMNQGNKIVQPPITNWQDDTEDEAKALKRAIAMSLAESRGEELELDEDSFRPAGLRCVERKEAKRKGYSAR